MIDVNEENNDVINGDEPYMILYGDYGNERADTPSKAVTLWFKFEQKDRGDAAIIAFSRDKAIELIKWSHDNIDKIKQLHEKYDNPYKLDYLIKEIEEEYKGGCKYFPDSKYGDQVHPYSFG